MSMKVHGFPSKKMLCFHLMDIHGSPWNTMNSHGFPWPFSSRYNYWLLLFEPTCANLYDGLLCIALCLSACLSGVVRAKLCTTSWVQDYVVHHQPALCTTGLCFTGPVALKLDTLWDFTSTLFYNSPAKANVPLFVQQATQGSRNQIPWIFHDFSRNFPGFSSIDVEQTWPMTP